MFQFLRPVSQNLYIYIWELCRTGGFVSVECRAGHIFSLWLNPQWRLLLDQESFAKYMVLWISAHFQTKQSPWTTQYHKEQMFWHLFLSHYMCWLGPHNNIIIMIRIWYLVRENDDHDEEGDYVSVCLVLANKTCSRTGLTSLSLRTCTMAPLSTSLIINCAKLFDWSAMTNCFTWITVWKTACCIVWGKCKMQLENICENSSRESFEQNRLRNCLKTAWDKVMRKCSLQGLSQIISNE